MTKVCTLNFILLFIFVVFTKIDTENHFIFCKILLSVLKFGMLTKNIINIKFIVTFVYFNKYIIKFKAYIDNIDFSPLAFFTYPITILNFSQGFNIINQFLVFYMTYAALTVPTTTIITSERANQRFFERWRICFYHFCKMLYLNRSQFFRESSQQ